MRPHTCIFSALVVCTARDELHWDWGELYHPLTLRTCINVLHPSQYDLSAAQFSPDGRVFQIEYASKAVENSG